MKKLSYLCLALAGLFLMTIYDFYETFLAGALFIAVPLFCLLAALILRRHISVSAGMPAAGMRGMPLPVTVTVKGRFLFFLSRFVFTAGAVTKEMEPPGLSFSLPAPHAGKINLPGHLSFHDLFGMKAFSVPVPECTALILPKRIGSAETVLSRISRLSSPDDTEYFGAVPYKQGDSPRLINWKVSARMDSLYTREAETSGASKFILAADHPASGDVFDIIGDAVMTIGSALSDKQIPFTFLYQKQNAPVTLAITNKETWGAALRDFVASGDEVVSLTSAPSLPILYIAGSAPSAPLPPHTTLWCAAGDAPSASLSGQAILTFLGGGTQ